MAPKASGLTTFLQCRSPIRARCAQGARTHPLGPDRPSMPLAHSGEMRRGDRRGGGEAGQPSMPLAHSGEMRRSGSAHPCRRGPAFNAARPFGRDAPSGPGRPGATRRAFNAARPFGRDAPSVSDAASRTLMSLQCRSPIRARCACGHCTSDRTPGNLQCRSPIRARCACLRGPARRLEQHPSMPLAHSGEMRRGTHAAHDTAGSSFNAARPFGRDAPARALDVARAYIGLQCRSPIRARCAGGGVGRGDGGIDPSMPLAHSGEMRRAMPGLTPRSPGTFNAARPFGRDAPNWACAQRSKSSRLQCRSPIRARCAEDAFYARYYRQRLQCRSPIRARCAPGRAST